MYKRSIHTIVLAIALFGVALSASAATFDSIGAYTKCDYGVKSQWDGVSIKYIEIDGSNESIGLKPGGVLSSTDAQWLGGLVVKGPCAWELGVPFEYKIFVKKYATQEKLMVHIGPEGRVLIAENINPKEKGSWFRGDGASRVELSYDGAGTFTSRWSEHNEGQPSSVVFVYGGNGRLIGYEHVQTEIRQRGPVACPVDNYFEKFGQYACNSDSLPISLAEDGRAWRWTCAARAGVSKVNCEKLKPVVAVTATTTATSTQATSSRATSTRVTTTAVPPLSSTSTNSTSTQSSPALPPETVEISSLSSLVSTSTWGRVSLLVVSKGSRSSTTRYSVSWGDGLVSTHAAVGDSLAHYYHKTGQYEVSVVAHVHTGEKSPAKRVTVVINPRVHGVCGQERYLCSVGSSANSTSTLSSYKWMCLGQNTGVDRSCVKEKARVGVPTVRLPKYALPAAETMLSARAVDGEGQKLRYVVRWGDGKTETTPLVDSGATTTLPHVWAKSGYYFPRVQAVAEDGRKSRAFTVRTIVEPAPVCSTKKYKCSSGTSRWLSPSTSTYNWACAGSGVTVNCSTPR